MQKYSLLCPETPIFRQPCKLTLIVNKCVGTCLWHVLCGRHFSQIIHAGTGFARFGMSLHFNVLSLGRLQIASPYAGSVFAVVTEDAAV